jgi:two-component system sensor histidine kinase MprB
VTFRVRLIVATAIAVAIAVLAACLASYFASRNAAQASVDSSLYSAANGPGSSYGIGEEVAGVFFQIVYADGQAYPSAHLPVDSTILKVANLKSPEVLRTTVVGDDSYRQLIIPLRAGTELHCASGPCILEHSAAQVFTINISGQTHQLRILALRLLLLALAGIIMALALGYFAAQAAMRPLDAVTNEIETVAETSNVSYRLEEGRRDELGRLRRVFNKLLASVEESQRLQRQLVLDSSHELRTPLTSLRTNAQVLAQADRLPPEELHQITTDMVSQVDELAALITDLSELARGVGLDDSLETIRLDDLVDECVATARTHGRVKDVQIRDDLGHCSVIGRRDRLSRAIANLLNNAIKFSPVGGVVEVTLQNGILTVADEGPGVPTEDAPYVFDRFWRSPRDRGLPGSGLGLAIVSQVATEMGGTVDVGRSPTLSGAQFTVTIPVVHDETVNPG